MSDNITIEVPDSLVVLKPHGAPWALSTIVVETNEDYDDVSREYQRCSAAEKDIEAAFEPAKTAANAAHKSICGLLNRALAPWIAWRSAAKPKLLDWEDLKRREAQEERRRLEEAARAAEEQRRLADALAAEASGLHEQAAQIMDDPVLVPVIHVEPEIPKTGAISSRGTWKAEVQDFGKLVRHVADHPEWTHLLQVNQPALNALAKSQKDRIAIPGVRGYEERNIASRSMK